jgi:hypothetical protein
VRIVADLPWVGSLSLTLFLEEKRGVIIEKEKNRQCFEM